MTRVLVITPLIWNLGEGAGMPSAYRTMAGFRDAGLEVHVLMPASRPWPATYDGLHLHTYRVPTFGLQGEFGPTRSALLVDLPEGAGYASARWKAYLGSASMLGAAHGLKLAARIKPDLVYGMMPVGALAASAVGWFAGIPNVTRLFGTMLADVPRRELPRNLWELAAYKAPADLWVLVDDGSFAEVVAKRHGVPPERIQHLLNGVDETYFEPWSGRSPQDVKRDLGLAPDAPLLLCAHQLLPWHNQADLIEAMRRLDARGVPGVALLAGDGPDRAELEAMVDGPLRERVKLLGNVSRERIRELMAASTAIVSLDGYSNVVNSVLEGLAMGVPAVATPTGTTTQLLEHERDALIVPEADPGALAAAIERVITDAGLRERLSAGARETAGRRLETWDARIAREAEILRGIALS